MIYFITILLIVLSFKYRKSNKLFTMLLIWLWVLYAFSSQNADYEMYKNLYKEYGTQPIQFGAYFLFNLSCKLFYNLHISYHGFLAIYSAIGLAIIGYTINKYCKEKNPALAMYMIFPFVFDVIQLKNFMAMAIIIFAIHYIIDANEENQIKNYIMYLILNIVAIGFHTFAALCIPFVVFGKMTEKKLNIVYGIFIFIIFILVVTKLFIPILGLVLPQEKITAYFIWETYKPGLSSTLKSIIIIVLLIISTHYFKYTTLGDEKSEQDNFNKVVINIFNYMTCLIIPLFYINQIMRLPRSLLILYYIMGINCLKIDGIKSLINKRNVIILLSFIMIIFVNYQTDIFSINNQDLTIVPLFKNNILFNFWS